MDLNLDALHSMGTTIIGITYNGGVVHGAESRTSVGMYVANRASDKITQLTDNVYVCRSGSAADSQVNTIQLGQPATVNVSANLIRMLAYNNKVSDKTIIKTQCLGIGTWEIIPDSLVHT